MFTNACWLLNGVETGESRIVVITSDTCGSSGHFKPDFSLMIVILPAKYYEH